MIRRKQKVRAGSQSAAELSDVVGHYQNLILKPTTTLLPYLSDICYQKTLKIRRDQQPVALLQQPVEPLHMKEHSLMSPRVQGQAIG